MTTRSPNPHTKPELVIHFGPKEKNYPCSAALNPETGELSFHFGGYGEPADILLLIPVEGRDLESIVDRMITEVKVVKVPDHIYR